MKINITARHLELTPALREYAEKRLEHVRKFTGRVTSTNVVLNVEKDRHIAEVTVAIAKSNVNAKAIAGDMYAALDLVSDKIVKQLKKHKEKTKQHKDSPSYSMIANIIWEQIEENTGKLHAATPEIEEVRELELKELSINEAVHTMEDKKLGFWVFKTKEEGAINVVYRKQDGSNGMLILK